MQKFSKLITLALFVLLFATFGLTSVSSRQSKIDFVRDIQPIFRASCSPCHFGDKPKGELRLDNKASAMKGGISGAVIKPGNGNGSRLLDRIQGLHGEKRMPLGGEPLAPAQVELIKRWIDEGAVWPEDQSAIRNRQTLGVRCARATSLAGGRQSLDAHAD